MAESKMYASKLEYLAQSNDTFLGSHAASLDHNEIVINFAIVRESTHGGDRFVCQIVFGGSVVLDNLVKDKYVSKY